MTPVSLQLDGLQEEYRSKWRKGLEHHPLISLHLSSNPQLNPPAAVDSERSCALSHVLVMRRSKQVEWERDRKNVLRKRKHVEGESVVNEHAVLRKGTEMVFEREDHQNLLPSAPTPTTLRKGDESIINSFDVPPLHKSIIHHICWTELWVAKAKSKMGVGDINQSIKFE
ncbi:hypothetical protein L218DRAFT_947393 [Marasmius fiardii PR-910]|nr:hypothetical protein L218DRAFT_947393 [Marasmius fiardii PR-910]